MSDISERGQAALRHLQLQPLATPEEAHRSERAVPTPGQRPTLAHQAPDRLCQIERVISCLSKVTNLILQIYDRFKG